MFAYALCVAAAASYGGISGEHSIVQASVVRHPDASVQFHYAHARSQWVWNQWCRHELLPFMYRSQKRGIRPAKVLECVKVLSFVQTAWQLQDPSAAIDVVDHAFNDPSKIMDAMLAETGALDLPAVSMSGETATIGQVLMSGWFQLPTN